MKMFTPLLFLTLLISCTWSIEMPVKWQEYLSNLRVEVTATILCPPSFQVLLSTEIPPDISTLLLPNVMFWNPLEYYSLLEVCPECNGTLKFHMWTNGKLKGAQPRILHDTNSIILLVAAVYKCSHNHAVYSTDPRLIKRIDQIQVPFVLLHRTGFTRSFLNCVISLAQEGLPIQAIVRHIQNLRERYMAELVLRLSKDWTVGTGQALSQSGISLLTTSTPLNLMLHPFPSNDIVTRCLIVNFIENQAFYDSQMLGIEVNKCIRIDHTFKVASNIGYLRKDGRWITQYGSIFIVLNDEGQVLTWQLTNSTSFEEVTLVLSALSRRIASSKEGPLIVYVDNCCHVRSKLKQMFGNDTIVKLDVFHAVQRVTRAMSKKHALFHTCAHDLRLVFRCKTDIGKKRTMNTPNLTVLLSNMDNFISKWENAEYNGQRILTEKTIKQLKLLKAHIECGCLSDIEPSGGTNYNEALHRHINPHFNHAGRMGLPLALALLTTLLYKPNSKKLASNSITQLIAAKLGIDCYVPQVPFGIVGKDDGGLSNNSWLRNSSISENELMTDEGLSLISVTDTERLLKAAISSANLAESMCKIIGNSPKFSYRMMAFMADVPSLYFRGSSFEISENERIQAEHSERLSNILDSCSMNKYPIVGDGNCCFSAVAFSLINNSNEICSPDKQFLSTLGLDFSMDVKTMAMQLRRILVSEWIENESWYKSKDFVVNDLCMEDEAQKFLISGNYYGDLADIMLNGLSNALRAPIIVFTSTAHHPFLCLTPQRQEQRILIPIVVAFTQFGPGHYDGVVPRTTGNDPEIEKLKCKCGKNDNKGGSHCQEIQSKYTTTCRCPCKKNNSECTTACRCKNCKNPHGQRSIEDVPKRKRFKHDWQQYEHMSSIEFAQSKREKITSGPLTKVEFFILENILRYCDENNYRFYPRQYTSNLLTDKQSSSK